MRRIHVAALVVALVVFGAGCPDDRAEPIAAGTAKVLAVIDGDTVVLELDGRRESVRLLGIDTPETNHPTRPVECFGAEATDRLGQLVPPGSTVRVERDVEARDHFGRLLLYLHRSTDDLFVNEAMVAEGFAATLHVDPNGAHRATLADAESEARARGLGLWGACGGPGVALDPLVAP